MCARTDCYLMLQVRYLQGQSARLQEKLALAERSASATLAQKVALLVAHTEEPCNPFAQPRLCHISPPFWPFVRSLCRPVCSLFPGGYRTLLCATYGAPYSAGCELSCCCCLGI